MQVFCAVRLFLCIKKAMKIQFRFGTKEVNNYDCIIQHYSQRNKEGKNSNLPHVTYWKTTEDRLRWLCNQFAIKAQDANFCFEYPIEIEKKQTVNADLLILMGDTMIAIFCENLGYTQLCSVKDYFDATYSHFRKRVVIDQVFYELNKSQEVVKSYTEYADNWPDFTLNEDLEWFVWFVETTINDDASEPFLFDKNSELIFYLKYS
jgi:hypothetical protein